MGERLPQRLDDQAARQAPSTRPALTLGPLLEDVGRIQEVLRREEPAVRLPSGPKELGRRRDGGAAITNCAHRQVGHPNEKIMTPSQEVTLAIATTTAPRLSRAHAATLRIAVLVVMVPECLGEQLVVCLKTDDRIGESLFKPKVPRLGLLQVVNHAILEKPINQLRDLTQIVGYHRAHCDASLEFDQAAQRVHVAVEAPALLLVAVEDYGLPEAQSHCRFRVLPIALFLSRAVDEELRALDH